jgi:gentisate 1,2-dioxygenase
MIRLLPAGYASRPCRATDGTVFGVAEGRGELRVGSQRLDLAPHDMAVVPGWMTRTLRAAEDLVLFSYSDRVAQEKLGLFREQRL